MHILFVAVPVGIYLYSPGEYGDYARSHVAIDHYIQGLSKTTLSFPYSRKVYSIPASDDMWKFAGRYSNASCQLQFSGLHSAFTCEVMGIG